MGAMMTFYEVIMFKSPVLIASILSYALMLVAYRFHRPRIWHVIAMSLCIVYGIGVPFYLFSARNWPHRLIDQGGIFNYLIWMHVGLDILLFTMFFLQITQGLKLWRGVEEAREIHAQQAKVILGVMLLVILTGGPLAP